MTQFLSDLFSDEPTPERRIAIFTMPARRTRFFSDYQEIKLYATQQMATQNVYFGLGLIQGNPRGRGKLEDIAGIGALWCDIDISSSAHPKDNLPKNIEEAQSLLTKMPLWPSIVVSSGHGLHAYWLLQEPWIFGQATERDRAASLAKYWHGKVCELAAKRGWALENLGDLTRVLRLPGTFNHNGADSAVQVPILERNSQRRYAVDDFEQFMPLEAEAAAPVEVAPVVLQPNAEPPASKLLNLASTSPAFWDTWNRNRSDLPDSSQSGYDLSLATIAALNDWTDQEVADLIIAHRRHQGENPKKSLRADYMCRTIAKARRAVTANGINGDGMDLSALLGPAANGVTPAASPFGPRAIVTSVDQVERQELEWLWPGRIPMGKLTLLAGDPGLGKSFVTLDMAARVSTGAAWPDMPLLKQTPGVVVLFNAEDDLADTIAPRLDKLEADDRFIKAVEGVALQGKRQHFSLERDIPRLEEVIDENPGTRLVVIDPIAAYCGKVDSHKNTDVRGLLAPLAELASRRKVAIVAVTHLSKAGGNKAVYRAMGSLAFAAAARAVWAIAKDTNDPQKRLFLPAKLNLAHDPDGLAYRIVEGRVAWDMEPVKMHADDAFAAEAAAAEGKTQRRGSERQEAIEWLQKQLAQGPVPASDVIELGEQFGFSKRTLQRAFGKLGGLRKKESFDGHWMWGLPGQDDSEGDTNAPLL